MKVTLNLDDEILRRAKTRAADEGISLTRFVEDALRSKLMDGERKESFKLDLVTVHGHAPPNVDISDRDGLYEVLDRPAITDEAIQESSCAPARRDAAARMDELRARMPTVETDEIVRWIREDRDQRR